MYRRGVTFACEGRGWEGVYIANVFFSLHLFCNLLQPFLFFYVTSYTPFNDMEESSGYEIDFRLYLSLS
jgi:hypothetical protein